MTLQELATLIRMTSDGYRALPAPTFRRLQAFTAKTVYEWLETKEVTISNEPGLEETNVA